MNSSDASFSPLLPGDVIYHEVADMGRGEKRPCLVIAGSPSSVCLIPLSSSNLNPSINPVIQFKGGISFVVFDHIFVMDIRECGAAYSRVSEGAIATCLKSLTAVVISGCWQ
jgi:hypothetical protein